MFRGNWRRERERESLHPIACGGGGRGGVGGKPLKSNKESCGLHTARVSCSSLLNFWSALGPNARMGLLAMEEAKFLDCLNARWVGGRGT